MYAAAAPPPGGIHTWSDERRSGVAAGFSLALHVLLFLLLALSFHFGARSRASKPVPHQVVSMRNISSSQWENNRVPFAKGQATLVHIKEPPNQKRQPLPRGQVVDVQPGNNKESADAKYLAETSNTVAKQTRAAQTTPFYGQAAPRTTTTTQPVPMKNQPIPQQKKGNHGEGADDRPMSPEKVVQKPRETAVAKRQQRMAMNTPDQSGAGVSLSNLLPEKVTPGVLTKQPTAADAPPVMADSAEAASAGREGVDSVSREAASGGVQGARAGAAANDALKDVPIGDGTFLNTREFKFAGFMNRVKQSVGAHWDPNAIIARHPSAGGAAERSTTLVVTLNGEGAIDDIKVGRSCGDESLDQEAISAFERSQPFPNPPRGLIEEDGKIRFAFGFLVEMSGMARFQPMRLR